VKGKSFEIKVEGIGAFVIRARTMGDELDIAAGYSEITRGQNTPSQFLSALANMVATLRVVVDKGPPGWDVDTLDPLDEDSYAQISAVYNEIMVTENSFRKGPVAQGEAQGAGDCRRVGVVDTSAVQPGSD